MDRSIVLSLLGLLLIVAVLVDTSYLNDLSKKWFVDPVASMVNGGEASIRNIITPPETTVVAYQDKSVILLGNTSQSDEEALLTDSGFRNALTSGDRLLLYTDAEGFSAVVASSYFNDVEVGMLSRDDRVEKALESNYPAGMVDLQNIDVADPTNAEVEVVEFGGKWYSLLLPAGTDNFSAMESSNEFEKVVEDSGGIGNKTLILYRPSNGNVNIIIPVNFSDDEVTLLAKNSAVKTAMNIMQVNAGETLNLAGTQEFQQVDMAQLPYQPNTRIYASFNINGELGFMSQDMVVYLAVFIVVLVMLYVLYTILVV
jgi:hypothetical protein